MKKILIIAIFGFSSIAYADNQYTMINENLNTNGGVWILDNKTQKLLYCWDNNGIRCRLPRDLEKNFEDKD